MIMLINYSLQGLLTMSELLSSFLALSSVLPMPLSFSLLSNVAELVVSSEQRHLPAFIHTALLMNSLVEEAAIKNTLKI
jgi:hypothetical protein